MIKKLYSREVKLKCSINQFGSQGYATHLEYFYCDDEEFLKMAQYKKHFKFIETTEEEMKEKYNFKDSLLEILETNKLYRLKLE